MDDQVLMYLIAGALLIAPGALTYGVVTGTRGWVRVVVLLIVFLTPPGLLYRAHDCLQHTDEMIEPCFAESMLAAASLWLGVSALAGTVAGAMRNLIRHAHAATTEVHP